MDESWKKEAGGLTRREALKLTGLAIGGLTVRGVLAGPEMVKADTCDNCCPEPDTGCKWYNPDNTNYAAVPPGYQSSQKYSYFETLNYFYPFINSPTTIAKLDADQMRITFMGSAIPQTRRAQQMMSVFVEVGWNDETQMPSDQFVFDCGAGVCANYGAMNVGFGRMDKIFIAHLHGDHISDLTHIYCFGPSTDRKSPLYVWGPGPSGVESPKGSGKHYNDGTKTFCKNLREACRWHSESFSFQTTRYTGYPTKNQIQQMWGLPCRPVPVKDDPWGDAFAMVPIELNWKKYGNVPGDNIAYCNLTTGVKISHFPVIHCRKGSIGYKLEWWPPGKDMRDPAQAISMIYTSDTKPEIRSRDQAINGGAGVDVFIHEMIVPANVWAMKYTDPGKPMGPEEPPPSSDPSVQQTAMVQNSSHSPQGAFGYLLSQIHPRPRLTVATHFPVADDTVNCAMNSVQEHFPDTVVYQGNDAPPDAVRMTWSFDLMVITVSKHKILEQRGYVSNFGFAPLVNLPSADAFPPKYHDIHGNGDPFAQIDTSTEIPACDCTTNPDTCNYRGDGY